MQQLDLFAPPKPAPIPFNPGDGGGRSRQLRDDWEAEKAQIEAALQRNAPEVLIWGKRVGYSGNYFEVKLLRDGDLWRVKTDHSMPNMGGGGPYGPAEHRSRDEALIATLRRELQSVASHLAGWGPDSMYGPESLWLSLARWCIEQGPPALFGGPDLAAEFEQLRATLTERNRLRCVAIHAGVKDYTGEDGRERSIYSL